jgi:Immunity protein 26
MGKRRLVGQVVKIDLKDGTCCFARVLKRPLFAFYGKLYNLNDNPSIEEICKLPIIFKIDVMDYAISREIWQVIGHASLSDDLKILPRFFKQDMMSDELFIYHEIPELAPSYQIPATYAEIQGLECAAVWDPEYVEERLRDHFAGRSYKWIEEIKMTDKIRAQMN